MIKTIHLLERFLSFCSSSICLWVKNNCSGGSGSETNNSLFLVLRSCFNYRLSLTSDNFICGGAETEGGRCEGGGGEQLSEPAAYKEADPPQQVNTGAENSRLSESIKTSSERVFRKVQSRPASHTKSLRYKTCFGFVFFFPFSTWY